MKRTKIFIGILFLAMMLISAFVMANSLKIRPNGQIDSEWTNVGCFSWEEWQCVDEDITNISDNLYTNSANKYESFTFQDTGFTNEIINSVMLEFYGQRYNNNSYKFQPLIRTNVSNNVTNYLNPVKSLTSSWAYFQILYANNPATGQPWSINEVNALEAGMKSYSSNPGGRIAKVYAYIDYSPFGYTCSDSDGRVITTLGNVTGYYNQTYYDYSDYCVGNTTVMEYFCSGLYKNNFSSSCIGNVTTACSDGRCI